MQPNNSAILEFLQRVHGPEPRGWLVIGTGQDNATRAFDLTQEGTLDLAVDYCADRAELQDVYAAVGLQAQHPTNGSLGEEDGVVALPGICADIDIAAPAHRARDLPQDEGAALSLVCSVGFQPSIVVCTGHGLQAYWLFQKPFVISNDDDRQLIKSLQQRFQQNLRLHARTRGWNLNATADLCRVLSVPGTLNRTLPDDVRLVTAEYSECSYSISDLEDLLAGLDHPGSLPPSQSPAPRPSPR